MSRKLLLMRHAKSSWDDNSMGDRNRQLNDRGERVAPLMGEFLKNQGFEPDFVWCSTAARTMQTLDLMLPSWNQPPVVETSDKLYLAPHNIILSILHRTPAEFKKVMVVGHNPGMQNLVGKLSREYHSVPTAAAALFELIDDASFAELDESNVRLVSIWLPKKVGVDVS